MDRSFEKFLNDLFSNLTSQEDRKKAPTSFKRQFLRKIASFTQQLKPKELNMKPHAFCITAEEVDTLNRRVRRLFSDQDLQLQGYHKIYSRWHQKRRDFRFVRSFSLKKTLETSNIEEMKMMNTILLRKRRIDRI